MADLPTRTTSSSGRCSPIPIARTTSCATICRTASWGASPTTLPKSSREVSSTRRSPAASDLLLKFRLASGASAFAYLLAEHKSTPDPGLPLQLASYMVRIWKRHAGAYAERLRALPPIIPVVVYTATRTGPWRAASAK